MAITSEDVDGPGVLTLCPPLSDNGYDDNHFIWWSMVQAADIPPGVSLQRRNSAPEMSEPAQFVDHGSMELW